MNAVVKQEEGGAVVDYSTSLMQVIASAARDPNVDIDKMERLLQMQERVQARDAEIAFSEAMATMQPLLPVITKRGQIVHSGKVISDFAEWSDIGKAITPVMAEHGFSLSFTPSQNPDGKPAVTATVRHRGGHKESASLSLPLDTSGAKNAVQAVGSSLSYGKRYTAVLLLNIQIEGEDDDGSAAAPMIQHTAPLDRPFPLGPAKNKTELKALARPAWESVRNCGDASEFTEIVALNDQLFKQLQAADEQGLLRGWWHTVGDSEGLGDLIARMTEEMQ